MSVMHPETVGVGSTSEAERERFARAAEALRDLMTSGPVLPRMSMWNIASDAVEAGRYGGEVVGQVSHTGACDDEWRAAFADLARRVAGALTEKPLGTNGRINRLAVTFVWRGVRVAVWQHVTPVGDRPARDAAGRRLAYRDAKGRVWDPTHEDNGWGDADRPMYRRRGSAGSWWLMRLDFLRGAYGPLIALDADDVPVAGGVGGVS